MSSVCQNQLRAEWVHSDHLRSLQDQWRMLFHQAASPNVFFGPDFFLPLVEGLKFAQDLKILLIWDHDELVAFLPIMRGTLKEKAFGIVCSAFHSPFSPCSLPLLHRNNTLSIAKTLLLALQDKASSGLAGFDMMIKDSQTALCLVKAADELGFKSGYSYSNWRAGLKRGLSCNEYITQNVDKRHVRELQRRERRLNQLGEVTFETCLDPSGINEAFEAFLKLEAEGWKGKQGSALLCNADHLAFARQALTGHKTDPGIVMDIVRLDGRIIAAAINLITNRHMLLYKSAYDENLSLYSPGVLCDLQTTRYVLDFDNCDMADSNAAPGHPMERWWHDTIEFGHLRIALDCHMDADILKKLAWREYIFRQGIEWIKAVTYKIKNHKTVMLRTQRQK
jgi:CelD/BcsL family acetyltransferase involved in cellulose biosynthesis